MRMDDNYVIPASQEPAEIDEPTARAATPRTGSGVRFTSNVVGSLFLVADVLCFILSAPITLAAYAAFADHKSSCRFTSPLSS